MIMEHKTQSNVSFQVEQVCLYLKDQYEKCVFLQLEEQKETNLSYDNNLLLCVMHSSKVLSCL